MVTKSRICLFMLLFIQLIDWCNSPHWVLNRSILRETSKYQINVHSKGGLLLQSITSSVFCSVENHVKNIIRLTIWLCKDGMLYIYTCQGSNVARSWQVWRSGVQGFLMKLSEMFMHMLKCCMHLKTQWSWSNPRKGKPFVIYTSSMASVGDMFDFSQSLKPVSKGLNFTTDVGCLHNQNLGMWCMKPHDTKHPAINGESFPLLGFHSRYQRNESENVYGSSAV